MPRPPPGYFSLNEIREQLQAATNIKPFIAARRMRALCRDCGIELYPLVVDGREIPNRYRWLTTDEAERVIALFYRQLADGDKPYRSANRLRPPRTASPDSPDSNE